MSLINGQEIYLIGEELNVALTKETGPVSLRTYEYTVQVFTRFAVLDNLDVTVVAFDQSSQKRHLLLPCRLLLFATKNAN